MGHDALMRWEWEGGTPDSVSEPARARPAENTDIRSQPTKRRQRARRVEVDQVVVPAPPVEPAHHMFEFVGIAGIVISVLAYLPQVVHLARQHCSAGVSGRAWAMWLASSLMVGALALHRHDPVFILLQVSTLLSATVIIVLVHRYRGMICLTHALAAREAARRRLGPDI